MGINCGVDMIEIDRVKDSIERSNRFLSEIFTDSEIAYCEERKVAKYQSYAARFAAKEAVAKALGTGFSKGVSCKDIEVVNNENGKPYVVLQGKAKEVYEELDPVDISISLSHCKCHAIAYVVIQTKI